jgi:hypothetical protein
MKFIYTMLSISLLTSTQSYAWVVNVGTQTVIKNSNNKPITISRGSGSGYANCGVRDDIVVPVGEIVNISGLFKAKKMVRPYVP